MSTPDVAAYMLGGFRLLIRGREVPESAWRRKKALQLLKYLLARENQRALKEEAHEVFWPDSDPTAASSNLRANLHAIRDALEPGSRASEGEIIVARGEIIGLHSGLEVWIDADAFEKLALEAQRSNPPLHVLEQACALYRGDYLPQDLYEDWAAERREALRRMWSDLEFQLAHAHLQRGQAQAAVPELQRLLRSDRCDERAAQELMRVLIQLGRRSEAARVYQNLEQALESDLGVQPSDTTRELHRQVAQQEVVRGTRRGGFRPSYSFPEPGHFIGRDAELAKLQRIVDAGRLSGQAVFLSAPAGTGKSTLAGALLRVARDAGVLCLAGAAYDERTGVPLAAFQEALTDYILTTPHADSDIAAGAAEVVNALSSLRSNIGNEKDSSNERSRLFAAVLSLLRKLAERGPVLMCLEDLHVADAASLNLLHYLLRQTRHTPVVFIGTFRTEALLAGEPLSQFMAAVERERLAERVQINPLDRASTERLIAALVGAPVHGNLSASVYATTEGNPLFIEQLVLALREEGRLDRPAAAAQSGVVDARTVPLVIREVITERVARLGDRSRQMLEMAAVLGHTFEYRDLLAVVDPADEALLLSDLDEAMTAQLLRERPTGYAFSHSLLRDGVYWGLSRTRRMLLHGRAGEVLERLAGDNSNAISAELAYHYARAGQTAPIRLKALHYSLRAGRQAAALASHREALQHFEVAATLVSDPALNVDNETRLAALEGRGAAEDGMGMWPSCITTFRQVLELAHDSLVRARAHRMISFELHHLGDTTGALHEAEAGLAEVGQEKGGNNEAAAIRLGLQHQLGLLLFLRGRFSEVLRLGEQMVEAANELHEPRWLAWAQHVVAWAYTGSGRTLEAIEQYEIVVSTAEQGRDKLDVAADITNLGIECYRARRFADARQHLERAVALYRESFSDFRSVLALIGLGWVHLALGDIVRAQEQADVAQSLAQQVHDRWLAECLRLVGALHTIRAEWAQAQETVAKASEMLEQVGHVTGTIDALIQLGRIAEYEDSPRRARELYERALKAAEQIDPSPSLVTAHLSLGLLMLHMDAPAGAEHVERAMTIALQMPDSLEYSRALLALAELRCNQDNLDVAIQAVREVLDRRNPALVEVQAEVLYSDLLTRAGMQDEAEAHVTAAIAIAERLGGPLVLGSAYRAAGQVALAAADYELALARLRSALQHFEAAAAPREAERVKATLQEFSLRYDAQTLIHHSSRHPYTQ